MAWLQRLSFNPHDWPIQRTLALLFLLILTLTLLPLSLLHAYNIRKDLERYTIERMLVAARDTSSELEESLARLLDHAHYLANDQPRMRAFLLGGARGTSAADERARSQMVPGIRKRNGYRTIAALSPDGKVLWQTGEDIRQWLGALTPEIAEARNGKGSLSDVLSDRQGRPVGVAAVMPVGLTPRERPRVLLVLVDSLEHLRKIVSHDRGTIGAKSFGVILHRDMRRLVHGADPRLEGLPVHLLPEAFAHKRNQPMIPHFYQTYVRLEHEPGFGVVVFLRSEPWSYSVLVPASHFLAPIRRALVQDALLFLGILAALCILAYLLGRWFLRPIASLQDTALAWQRGELDARAVPGGKNEIGTLGRSFNQMAAQIQAYTQDLERMVEARTQELTQLNQTLRDRERRLIQAQKIAQLGNWEWDLETDRMTWSEGCYLISKQDPATWPPSFEAFLATIHPDDRPRVEEAAQAAFRGEADFDVEFRQGMPDDSQRIMHAQGEVIRDEQGKPVCIYGFIQDITERKQLEDELRQRYEGLKELDRLKNSFINALSHELRTPLTAILGYAELLEDELGGPLAPDQRDFIREIQRGGRRLESLLNDLLDFVRMEAGTFRLNLSEGDFTSQARAALDDLAHQATEAGVTLVGPLPDAPVTLCMDARRIKQVLHNLLSNAIKFSPAQGMVQVRILREDAHLRCEIQDQGEGIAPEDQGFLFQRFRQLESGVRKGKGAGLGLSISKALVEAHGGEIGVISARGQGSTFWFTLPLVKGNGKCPPNPDTAGPAR